MARLGLCNVRRGGRGVDAAFDGRQITKKALSALDLTSSLTQGEVEGCVGGGSHAVRADEDSEEGEPAPGLMDYYSTSEDDEELDRIVLGTRKEHVAHRKELFRESETLLGLSTGRG
jgi:hypothetical protein